MSAHKGGGGWGGQEIGFKMEVDHDWSSDMRLQGCAGFVVADMQQNHQHRKRLANLIKPSTSTPLIIAKPGPSQGQKLPIELATPHAP